MNFNKGDYKICVVGLGYVGLPLAARFSLKKFNVVGFDINKKRVEELKNNIDSNDDISLENLKVLNQNSKLTSNSSSLKDCDIFIVTVPTPINTDKTPDLGPIIAASKLVGGLMKKGSIVIYESTVYPGVTDDICTPVLERESSYIFNKSFSTAYSPERIVPGDKINTIEKIKKIVSASNKEALDIVSFFYSSIIDAGIYQATSIKVAEAAKVTENIQRDVNIALINEMHQLYSSLGISTKDIIEAASTKWNFMKLTPGLVGGHCISIDPYYLMHKSEISGYSPNIMRASRKINDEMGVWVKDAFLEFSKKNNIDIMETHITFLGYSFKENCSDTRNTKVKELIYSIKDMGCNVSLWDPIVKANELLALEKSGVEIHKNPPQKIEFAFLCVEHDQIKSFLNNYKGLLFNYRDIDFN
jgi:UDP-N-acetyl-D-glucosamine/UDP-N-acetyl-D-galactosamine dehydrogenase